MIKPPDRPLFDPGGSSPVLPAVPATVDRTEPKSVRPLTCSPILLLMTAMVPSAGATSVVSDSVRSAVSTLAWALATAPSWEAIWPADFGCSSSALLASAVFTEDLVWFTVSCASVTAFSFSTFPVAWSLRASSRVFWASSMLF